MSNLLTEDTTRIFEEIIQRQHWDGFPPPPADDDDHGGGDGDGDDLPGWLTNLSTWFYLGAFALITVGFGQALVSYLITRF